MERRTQISSSTEPALGIGLGQRLIILAEKCTYGQRPDRSLSGAKRATAVFDGYAGLKRSSVDLARGVGQRVDARSASCARENGRGRRTWDDRRDPEGTRAI